MAWRRILRWIAKPWSREQRELDLDRELRAHLDLEAEEQQEAGLAPEEARYRARRALGSTALIKEDVRQTWRWASLERLGQDVRHVLRALRRSPGFAAVTILSLAIGIGASTSVFTVFHALFLRALPVRDPQQLRIVNWTGGDRTPAHTVSGYLINEGGGQRSGSFSFEAFQAFQRGATGFASVAGFTEVQTNVAARSEASVASAQLVSASFFETLGIQPSLGRGLAAQDDSLGAPPAAVLSWRLWQRLFGGDPSAVGSAITVERVPYTVIGILPPRFVGLSSTRPADVYVPLARAEQFSEDYAFAEPDNWWIEVVGRVAPGEDDRQVRAALDVILDQIARAYGSKAREKVEAPKALLIDGRAGKAFRYTSMSQSLLTLFAMVGLVLLVACANVANLLLARGDARGRELAVRLSLGAGRLRIVRHLLTESLVLALAGGALGFLLARLGTVLLAGLLVQARDPAIDLRPDAAVLGFAIVLSVATALVFGVVPAFRSTKVHPASCLKQGGAGGGSLRQGLAKALIVAQVAVAFVLVFGAGLFARTLVNLGRVELGFRADNILLFHVDPSRNGYKEQRLIDAYRRIREGVAAVPGVREVTFSRFALVSGSLAIQTITVPGYTPRPGERPGNLVNLVGDGFLGVMGIPVLLGRDLLPSDDEGSAQVAVVNQRLAKKYFSGNPVGREFSFSGKLSRPIRIVGVAANAKYDDVRPDVEPTIYLPYAQHPARLLGMTFALRTSVDPPSLANAVRRVVAGIDPLLPVAAFRTQRQQIDRSLASERTFAFLASFFSAVTVMLACIGIYGVLAYAVARRTCEFGVRMAIGATRAQVHWLVLRGSVFLVGLGLAIGIPAALSAVKLISTRLFGVEPADPATIAAAAVAMVIAAGLAAWIPARRAALLDPTVALRYE